MILENMPLWTISFFQETKKPIMKFYIAYFETRVLICFIRTFLSRLGGVSSYSIKQFKISHYDYG